MGKLDKIIVIGLIILLVIVVGTAFYITGEQDKMIKEAEKQVFLYKGLINISDQEKSKLEEQNKKLDDMYFNCVNEIKIIKTEHNLTQSKIIKYKEELNYSHNAMEEDVMYIRYMNELITVAEVNAVLLYLNDLAVQGYQIYPDDMDYYIKTLRNVNNELYSDYKTEFTHESNEYSKLVEDNYNFMRDNIEIYKSTYILFD